MGIDEQRAAHRLELLQRLKDKYQKPDPEALKNKLKIEQAKADIYQQILRAESPPGDPSFCFDCWVEYGENIRSLPKSSGYGFDIFCCARGHEYRVQHR